MFKCTSLSFFVLFAIGGPHGQHSYPNLNHRRGGGRRLPPTPSKPSTLQLKPTNINFPKLNASPTHVSILLIYLLTEIGITIIAIKI